MDGTRTIVVIGEVNFDTTLVVNNFPVPGESVKAHDYKQSPGGRGANASIAAFRSSHKRVPVEEGADQHKYVSAFPNSDAIQVRLLAVTGGDANGRVCRDSLESSGIDISEMLEDLEQDTSMCVCIVERDSGQSRVIMSHLGANNSDKAKAFVSPDLWADGGRPDLLISQLGLDLHLVYQILDTAGKEKIDILLNAAPARNILWSLYRHITHFIVNETQAAILSGSESQDVNIEACPGIAETFLARGVKNVVIRLGMHGAYYAQMDDNGVLQDGHVPAYDVRVKDATGASSTFVGAYASSYVRQKSIGEWNIKDAVERASAATVWTIGEIGAQVAIPWADQIDSMLAQRSEMLEASAEATELPPTTSPNGQESSQT